MRAAFACLTLSFALTLFAQQNPDNQPQNQAPAAGSPAQAAPSPGNLQPGHPLDPHDVETLTGKSATSVPASARAISGGYAGYYPYSADVPLFTGGQFNSTRAFGDQRFFRNFGLFNPRGFLFFGSRGFGRVGPGGFSRFSTQPSTGTVVAPGR